MKTGQPIHSPHYWADRRDPKTGKQHRPKAIICHITDGNYQSTKSWFENPRSYVSAHWVIDELGIWHKCVDEKDAAWHAGKAVNPTWSGYDSDINTNLTTIGIEVVNRGQFPPFQQWASWVKGTREICHRWKIGTYPSTIVGHNEIRADKRCPRPFYTPQWFFFLSKFIS